MVVAEAAVQKAHGTIKAAEDELHVCDTKIGTAVMERYQLQELHDNPASATASLARLLLTSHSEHCLVQLNEAISQRDQTIRQSAVARISYASALADARRGCAIVETKCSAQRDALDKASDARYACAAKTKEAWEAERQVPAEQSRCDAVLADIRARLAAFRDGPLSTVTLATQAAAPRSHAAIRENASKKRRASLSVAEITRRRSSFVPRKRALLSAKVDIEGSVLVMSSLPTPARHLSEQSSA